MKKVLGYIRNFGWCMLFFALGKTIHSLFNDTSDIPFAIVFGLIGLGIVLGMSKLINRKAPAAPPTK